MPFVDANNSSTKEVGSVAVLFRTDTVTTRSTSKPTENAVARAGKPSPPKGHVPNMEVYVS